MARKATQRPYFLQYHLPNVMMSYLVKPASADVPAAPTVKIYMCLLAYLLTYLLHGAILLEKLVKIRISRILWNPNIHQCPPPVPILSQSISPGPRLSMSTFRNKIWLYSGELLTPRPTPNLEDHPFLAVHDCLFNIFAATLHFGGRSPICNLRTHHAVVTGPHLSRDIHVLPWRLKQ